MSQNCLVLDGLASVRLPVKVSNRLISDSQKFTEFRLLRVFDVSLEIQIILVLR